MLEVYLLKDKVVTYVTVWMVQAWKLVEISIKGIKQRKEGMNEKHMKEMIHIEFWWTSTYYDIVLVSYNFKHPLWVSYKSDDESTVSCWQLQGRLESLHTGDCKLQITT